MIGDFYRDKWTQPEYQRPYTWITTTGDVPKADFDKLKKEVEDMKELLKRAKLYDEQNGEPDCEMDDKVELLKKFAKALDVSLEDIFEK